MSRPTRMACRGMRAPQQALGARQCHGGRKGLFEPRFACNRPGLRRPLRPGRAMLRVRYCDVAHNEVTPPTVLTVVVVSARAASADTANVATISNALRQRDVRIASHCSAADGAGLSPCKDCANRPIRYGRRLMSAALADDKDSGPGLTSPALRCEARLVPDIGA